MRADSVIVCEAPAAAMAAAGARIATFVREPLTERGCARIALAGGRTPEAVYRLLAEPPYRERVDWARVEVFWGDERCVPPDHTDSNYRMALEALISRVPVPAAHVHRMRGEVDPTAAAQEYERTLRTVFGETGDGPPRLDLILLGLGSDGHTASLFPGTPVVREAAQWVAAAWVAKFEVWRLTLTPPSLNAARHVLFLVTGPDKAEAVRAVLEGPLDPDRLPAQIVRPSEGRVEWILDREAASRLGSSF